MEALQEGDNKPGILFDGANVQNIAMKCENEKEHFDVEGEVIKVELKMESGNDSVKVVC